MTDTVSLPAGTYWIGDPCYIVPADKWIELLDAADYFFNGKPSLVFEGRHIAAFSTLDGDGNYKSSISGKTFWVDAGIIGAVQVSRNNDSWLTNVDHESGIIIDFPTPFFFTVDDGTFDFDNGRLLIWTKLEEEDEWDWSV